MNTRVTLAEIAKAQSRSKRAVEIRADREAWPCVEEPVRGGKRRLYAPADLPTDVRQALLTHKAARLGANDAANVPTAPAPNLPAPPVADTHLTDRQRLERDARAGVLSAVRRLQADTGCSQEAALTTLLTSARAGRLDAHVDRMLQLARDPRGRKGDGYPSARTLKRWLGAKDLAPRAPQRDMAVKPWHALAVSLRQRPQGSTLRWLHEQLVEQWNPVWGDNPPSYDVVARFFREKFSAIDQLVGRHNGMDLQSHRRYNVRTRAGLLPAMECHADGWCTHFSAPHPVTGEYVTYEVWTAIDFATGYPADPAIGMTESFEVIAKCLENYIRTFGVPAVFQTDSTGSVKNDRFEFDPITSLQERLGITIVHPAMLATGKGNSQANGLAENLHAFYDREARALATYQGKSMDSLAFKRVQKFTTQMVRAAKRGDLVARDKAKREAERAGKGLVIDSFEEGVAVMQRMVEKRRDMPNRNLPKIDDPATGKRRHMTPRERLEQFRAEGWEPVAMSDAAIVDAFRPHVKKQVKRGGVSPYGGQRYDHPELEHWNGEWVQVAIDIMDWRRVWVKDLQGRFICEAQFLEGRLPRPQSLYEAALEKRERAAVRRREQQIESIAARNPFRTLDALAEEARVIDFATEFFSAPEPAEALPAATPATERTGAVTAIEPAERQHNDITDIAMYLYGDQLEDEETEDLKKAAAE